MRIKPRRNSTYFVYLLRCAGDTLYCGMTNDFALRLKRHQAGKGARYTRSHQPVELAWKSRRLPTRSIALRLEARIKHLSRREKLAMIARGKPPRLAPRKSPRKSPDA
jgi:putative endonuclease